MADHLLDVRNRDLADLLDGLDLDLRHVHVARERNLLDLDARDMADHLLDVRNLHRDVLDLDLRNFDLPVNGLDLDTDNLTDNLLHLDLRHVADHLLDLGDFDDDVLDLHLGHLDDALHGLDPHTRHLAVDDLRLHTRHGALNHMRHVDVHHALGSHHLRRRGHRRGHHR